MPFPVLDIFGTFCSITCLKMAFNGLIIFLACSSICIAPMFWSSVFVLILYFLSLKQTMRTVERLASPIKPIGLSSAKVAKIIGWPFRKSLWSVPVHAKLCTDVRKSGTNQWLFYVPRFWEVGANGVCRVDSLWWEVQLVHSINRPNAQRYGYESHTFQLQFSPAKCGKANTG